MLAGLAAAMLGMLSSSATRRIAAMMAGRSACRGWVSRPVARLAVVVSSSSREQVKPSQTMMRVSTMPRPPMRTSWHQGMSSPQMAVRTTLATWPVTPQW